MDFQLLEFLDNEVTKPRNDGTRGSALYAVPYRLSGRPDRAWVELLEKHWRFPSRFTSMHRGDILRVSGDRVILDGTTVEEVAKYHLETLKLAISAANKDYSELLARQQQVEERRAQADDQHRRSVQEMKDRLKP